MESNSKRSTSFNATTKVAGPGRRCLLGKKVRQKSSGVLSIRSPLQDACPASWWSSQISRMPASSQPSTCSKGFGSCCCMTIPESTSVSRGRHCVHAIASSTRRNRFSAPSSESDARCFQGYDVQERSCVGG
ncbi:TPA: hypothetical protein N0F65_010569 [Lagenidium giganteum]|uniref:Uncharacterized protein n=1 Tax=Lagenidium giganteum TaxID=4803 RepID=A0AAV2ZC71_9STRA|nr:TPA: hypothetical protein N0F65_010569 [Lagenidium giganteum]